MRLLAVLLPFLASGNLDAGGSGAKSSARIIASASAALQGFMQKDCDPSWVGLAAGASAAPDALPVCGAALLRGALPASTVASLLAAFLALPPETLRDLRHGAVRAGREQTHLPFAPPFSQLPLLGTGSALLRPLASALGPGFELDLATVVAVPPGGSLQEPHRDCPDPGNVAVHVPLHFLANGSAPLALCAGTHKTGREEAAALLREAILWRGKGETSLAAKQRLYCGGRQRTEALAASLSGDELLRVRVMDGRLGAAVRAVPEGLKVLRPGDEVTRLAGRKVGSAEDFRAAAAVAGEALLEVAAERPLQGEGGGSPPKLLLAAPLEAGDALLYDSRLFHWGTAHSGSEARYVMYLNFRSKSHGGVHAEAEATDAVEEARASFRRKAQEEIAASERAAEL